MAVTQHPPGVLEEIADFLSAGPTPEELLRYRPSPQLQARAQELLQKLKDGCLSTDERQELDQFEHTERLMCLTKARIHARKAQHP
jgi:hypothetical protein